MITTLRRILPLLLLLLMVVATLLAKVAAGPGTIGLDLRLTHRIQQATVPGLAPVTDLTNWFFGGHVLTASTLILAAILFATGRRAAVVVMLGTLPLRLLNSGIKDIVASPRPAPDQVRVEHVVSGYGFPSGHTAGAVLLLGTCAWALSRDRTLKYAIAIWSAAVIGVGITAIGRIRVGAHWPSDTIGAVLWTAPALTLLIVVVTTVIPGNGKRRDRIASITPFGLGRWR